MASHGTRIFWTREAETSLIEAVSYHPTLWDAQNENYKLKGLRKNLFASVADIMNSMYPQLGTFTSDIVRKKFGNLKDYYIREKKKRAGGEAVPKWELYKLLEFLDKCSAYSSSCDNLTNNPDNYSVSPECMVLLSVNSSDTEDFSSSPANTGNSQIAENAIPHQEDVRTNALPLNEFTQMSQLTNGICSSSGDTSSISNAPTTSTPLTQKKHTRALNTHPKDSNTSKFYEQLNDIISPEQDFGYCTKEQGSEQDGEKDDEDDAARKIPLPQQECHRRKRKNSKENHNNSLDTLMRYLVEKKKEEHAPEPIDTFFSLMAATVKKFSPADQHFMKTKVFTLVSEIEGRYIYNQNAQTHAPQTQNICPIPTPSHALSQYSTSSSTRLKQRAVIEFLTAEGVTSKEIHRRMQAVYGACIDDEAGVGRAGADGVIGLGDSEPKVYVDVAEHSENSTKGKQATSDTREWHSASDRRKYMKIEDDTDEKIDISQEHTSVETNEEDILQNRNESMDTSVYIKEEPDESSSV
ncbi:uncharacterized protein LOC143034410 [Oratosquilla oratoria]|uniref:uncharacterized protein LOC143034410 n=1 Tax=Oratosquilla oratoria TaxID=337810 RepID=UPI003F76E68D